jgi:hypothetical protein
MTYTGTTHHQPCPALLPHVRSAHFDMMRLDTARVLPTCPSNVDALG